MGQPVVHFEVIGEDPQKLRDYYTGLFGWEFETPSPVAQEVQIPGATGFWTSLRRRMGQASGVA
jgi:predicted enzyme related to lactoylglutathione lyase